ncbi:MAG: leucine-rich repeat domain-containing protein, partial [Promethearchaeota archaeon]
PDSIGSILLLEHLDLSSTNMVNIPTTIGNLSSLKELNLSSNATLKTIPEPIGNLSSLIILNLHSTSLSGLPERIGKLANLETLDLGRIMPLEALPDSIGNLSSLKTLDLAGNKNLTSLPQSIGGLTSLQILNLEGAKITSIPESIGGLTSLKRLNLLRNQVEVLPESIGKLLALQELDLSENRLKSLPESTGNLLNLEALLLGGNNLLNLPYSVGNLENIKLLSMSQNQLQEVPDSIGKLKSLQKLSLLKNELTSLPRDLGDLVDLEYLDLRANKFTELPGPLWSLINLKDLKLDNNPWNETDQYIINKQDLRLLRDECRKRATINVFLSHAVVDFDYFRIKDMSEYLEKQNEVYKAYYCEEDLTGNIDDFMDEKVPQCQLVLFFGSNKSVNNSIDCAHEIELANKHEIKIVPIKGQDVSWEDLGKTGLSRELGHEFIPEEFDTFCEDMFNYVKKLKEDVNLFDTKEGKIDTQKLNINSTLGSLFDSNDFRELIAENVEELKTLFEDLNANKITPMDYYLKTAQLLSKK